MENVLQLTEVRAAQICDSTKAVEFKWVNCMICELYLNKAVLKNITEAPVFGCEQIPESAVQSSLTLLWPLGQGCEKQRGGLRAPCSSFVANAVLQEVCRNLESRTSAWMASISASLLVRRHQWEGAGYEATY